MSDRRRGALRLRLNGPGRREGAPRRRWILLAGATVGVIVVTTSGVVTVLLVIVVVTALLESRLAGRSRLRSRRR
ncbi:hypothetical protein Aau02nite_48980 [Amorphoplanes auranticolor]|uniref:Uncharacterized protein n=1 Tax=Actinoplanes auranticolor TaxID=47988 RepID=A0A919VQ27_9ACTN|nr:hypothetical protein Aau02nite_48980 [Actinoplanes auranticolor]